MAVKEVTMEKVEVLTCVRDQDGTYGPGTEIEVPAKEVHALVMSEAVKRLNEGHGTDDEKIREARVKVTKLETVAMELQKKASDNMVMAITLGGKEAQDDALKHVAKANEAKAEAVKAAADLVKAEAAAVEKAAKKAAAPTQATHAPAGHAGPSR